MDYPCGKFSDCTFSLFGFIVQTNSQTHTQTPLTLNIVPIQCRSRSPLEKKRRVLRKSGPVPGLLAYWPSRLKALVAMGRVTYASLIGLTIASLKAYERG